MDVTELAQKHSNHLTEAQLKAREVAWSHWVELGVMDRYDGDDIVHTGCTDCMADLDEDTSESA